MIMKLTKKRSGGFLIAATVTFLLTITLIVTAIAATDLTNTVKVSDLGVSTDGATAWKASEGQVEWSGTSTSSGGCSPTFTPTSGTLTFTNNSGSTKVLSFNYTLTLNGGSFKIAGESKAANGSFSATLADGEFITLEASSSTGAANKTTVTLSNIKLEVTKIDLTFAPSANGSYTLDSVAVTENVEKKQVDSTNTYALVATPADNYHFDGWYLENDSGSTKVSESANWSGASFATSGTVTAKFVPDFLYSVTNLPPDSAYTIDDLIAINSHYYHDTTSKVVLDGGIPTNQSAYSNTAQSGTKDKTDITYIPSLQWSQSMTVSTSGSATGDCIAGSLLDKAQQQSHATVRMLSDVIQIRAKKNCNITFDYTNDISGGESGKTTNIVYRFLVKSSKSSITSFGALNVGFSISSLTIGIWRS